MRIETEVASRLRGTMEPLRSVLRPAARLRVARWMEARSARFWALLLGVVALLVRLPLIFADHAITPGGDSAGYVEIARSLADGDGFERHIARPAIRSFSPHWTSCRGAWKTQWWYSSSCVASRLWQALS